MTAEELLATMAEPLPEDDGYCTIDPKTRVITIPPEYRLLGVESDEKAERLYFKCPKIVGDDIDLSKLALRVNFRNAGQVVDQYLVDDVAVDGDNITFSWLLSRRVTQYEGDVNFIVCAVRVSGETITNEWNTTLATAQVLEGLEAEMVLPEDETDIVNQLLALAETRLNDVKKATADANTAASNANQKAQEAENATEDARSVIEQITKDSYLHTALQSFIDTVTTTPTAYGNAIAKKIEGFIRQETTTGAQLFNINAISTQGSATYKIINDTTVEITGGKSDQNVYSKVNFSMRNVKSLIQGKKIYLYCKFTGDHKPQAQLTITPASGGTIYKAVWSNSWTGVGIPSDCEDIIFGLYPSTETGTTDTVTFSDIKIGLTQFETWEPYTGGQPAPNPDYPQIVHGVGDMGFFDGELLQGYYQASDGTFKPATVALCNKNPIPCKPGDKIIFEYEDVINGSGITIFFYKSDGTFISRVNKVGVRKIEGVAPQDTTYCNIVINPVSDPIPVASAKHITVTINDKYAVCVKSKGKNLLNLTGEILYSFGKETIFDNQVTIRPTTDGRSAPGVWFVLGDIKKFLGKTIYVKADAIQRSGNYNPRMLLMTIKGNTSVRTYLTYSYSKAGQVMSVKIPDDLDTNEASDLALNMYVNDGSSQVDADAYAIFTNVYAGLSEPTNEFVPYQSNVTYIPVDYPLFEGDKIVRRNGEYKLIRKWGFKTYDGSDDENWLMAKTSGDITIRFRILDDTFSDDTQNVWCNRFKNRGGAHTDTEYCLEASGAFYANIEKSRLETEEPTGFKNWLKNHELIVIYELATPTEEPLSPEAQKALHSIMATDEQTELTIVGVPADAEISNQFLLPRNEDGALNTTAYCTAEKNKIVLNELVAQNLDARVNKLEIDNASLAEQSIVVE